MAKYELGAQNALAELFEGVEEDTPNLPAGSLLAKRFEITRLLGSGASGAVYLCVDHQDGGRIKAIKVLSRSYSADDTNLSRFYREGKAASKIRSDCVVHSYDIVMADGFFAYTMEYVEGATLAEYLIEHPNPHFAQIEHILIQLASGLEAIHLHGIVHRDLKPQNVLVSPDFQIKITDFGIARVMAREKLVHRAELCARNSGMCDVKSSRAQNQDTQCGALLGTLDYLSPEYVLHDQIDQRSDIYAFGLIAYQLITGDLPFKGPTAYVRMMERAKHAPKKISELRPDCSRTLADLLDRCLALDPEDRPQTGMLLVRELVRVCGDG